jgi:hypothetical protein
MRDRVIAIAAAALAAGVLAQVPNSTPTYQLNQSTIIMVRTLERCSGAAQAV